MQYEVEVGGRLRQVSVARTGDGFAVALDGHTHHVDAVRIDAHTLSLVVDTVWPDATGVRKPDATGVRKYSHEVTVTGSPAGALSVTVGAQSVAVTLNGRRRWGRKDEARTGGSGPQRLTAPMPGKVVRVLVQPGDVVQARQPVIVIEAMKMENELRAAREGTVADVHAREGSSVEAGALLVVIQ
jgi:biotin carboxyl carrier protein